jgi:MFS family permease
MLGVAMMVGMGIGSGIMMPLLTLYAVGVFGVSFVVAATITSVRDVFKAPMEVIAGLISDRWGRKLVLIAGFLGYALGFVVSVEADGLFLVYVGSAIAGIGAGGQIPAAQAYIGDIVPKKYQGRAMSVYLGLYSLGVAIGLVLCGYMADSMGYKNAILVGASFLVLGSLVYWFGLSETVNRAKAAKTVKFTKADMMLLFKNWNIFIIAYLTFFLAVERMDMTSTLLPLFALKGIGINIKSLGFSLLPVAFIAILAFPGGWIADKWGRKQGLILSFAIIAIGMFLLAITKNMTMLLISSSIVFGGAGLAQPALAALINDVVPAKIRATCIGITRLAWDLAMVGYPPLVLGIAQKWGWPLMWIFIGICVLTALVITLTIVKPVDETEAEVPA